MAEGKKIKVISEKELMVAVEFLKSKNREPTRDNVAKKLNVRVESLIRWSARKKKLLKDLGIVEAGRERKISEGKIKKAVEELKSEKIKPTIIAVSKKLGVRRDSLSRWSIQKKKPLEVYGIYVMRPITEHRIREAVEFLKRQKKKPTRKAVAQILGVNFHSLSAWSRANKIPLERLGVAMWRPNIISEARIKEIVESLKREGLTPNRSNVAKRLGTKYKYLTKWSCRKKISLETLGVFTKIITKTKIEKVVESFEREKKKTPTTEEVAKELGVKEKCLLDWIKRNEASLEKLRIAKRKKERKISKELIEQAVRELRQIEQRPTPKNVAKKLGIYIGSLYKWSRENKIPLKVLGIVPWKRISKESIEEAVKALKLENKEVITSNIAEKLEVKVDSLYGWSSNAKTPLKDLGIVTPKKIPKPHKTVIRKVIKKERSTKKIRETKITPGEKEIKAEQERLLKIKEFIDTFNKAKELFETKEPEKLRNAISLLQATITRSKDLGEKDILREAEDYLNKIKNLIKEQFDEAENMLRLGWPEEAIPLFELVIELEEPFKEKVFFLSAYEGLRKAKDKLQEKEEKRKQWELTTKSKTK